MTTPPKRNLRHAYAGTVSRCSDCGQRITLTRTYHYGHEFYRHEWLTDDGGAKCGEAGVWHRLDRNAVDVWGEGPAA